MRTERGALRVHPLSLHGAMRGERLAGAAATPWRAVIAGGQKLHIKHQVGVWRYRPSSLLPVAVVGTNIERRVLSQPHLQDALIPALDHRADADQKGERLAARARAVKDRAGRRQPAGIVRPHDLAGPRRAARTLRCDRPLDAHRGWRLPKGAYVGLKADRQRKRSVAGRRADGRPGVRMRL